MDFYPYFVPNGTFFLILTIINKYRYDVSQPSDQKKQRCLSHDICPKISGCGQRCGTLMIGNRTKKSLTTINFKNRLKIGKKIAVVICLIMDSNGQLMSLICNEIYISLYLAQNANYVHNITR